MVGGTGGSVGCTVFGRTARQAALAPLRQFPAVLYLPFALATLILLFINFFLQHLMLNPIKIMSVFLLTVKAGHTLRCTTPLLLTNKGGVIRERHTDEGNTVSLWEGCIEPLALHQQETLNKCYQNFVTGFTL